MFVRPKPGLKVRHNQTRRHIPAAGLEVPDGDRYFTRRLIAGDVELVAAPVEQPAVPVCEQLVVEPIAEQEEPTQVAAPAEE